MKYKILFVIFFVIVLLNDAHAMRCSRKLIQVGDYVSRMFNYCGQPRVVMRDVSVLGEHVVYSYEMNGRTKYITTKNNIIISMRSE